MSTVLESSAKLLIVKCPVRTRYSGPRSSSKTYWPTGSFRVILPGKTKWSPQKGIFLGFRGLPAAFLRCMRQGSSSCVCRSTTVISNCPPLAAWARGRVSPPHRARVANSRDTERPIHRAAMIPLCRPISRFLVDLCPVRIIHKGCSTGFQPVTGENRQDACPTSMAGQPKCSTSEGISSAVVLHPPLDGDRAGTLQ